MSRVIAVDFDGTICRNKWPEIGEANDGLIAWLKGCREQGDKLILYTCREGQLLAAAVMWCKARGLEFDALNDNLPERVEEYGNNCRKISADIYLDDRAIGVFYPPQQSMFYVQGTEGKMMRADVERCSAVPVNEETRKVEHHSVEVPAKVARELMTGYQYKPGKAPLTERARKAWRALRGVKYER